MIEFLLNGEITRVDVEDDTPLLWVLRENLKLIGTKFGCGMGLCGACTVHLAGVAVRSCQTTVGSVQGQAITTIEGIGAKGLTPVQQAWVEGNVPQCGYCQSGQIMAASALLAQTPHPTDDEITVAMNGNLCRCGCYNRIRAAIHRAAELNDVSGAKVAVRMFDPNALLAGERVVSELNINRRAFLTGTAVVAGGLVLGVFPAQRAGAMPNARVGSFQANAWLQITPADEVIFQLDKTEMGQGVMTALPTILAEELDIDPRRIVVELAPVNKAFQDPIQVTGGSASVSQRWDVLRTTGAQAREMLVAAAAARWAVQPDQCKADNGRVLKVGSDESFSYGELANDAAKLPVPKEPVLKDPSEFKYIGKSLRRFDGTEKSGWQCSVRHRCRCSRCGCRDADPQSAFRRFAAVVRCRRRRAVRQVSSTSST